MNRLAPALANLVGTHTCQYESRPNGSPRRARNRRAGPKWRRAWLLAWRPFMSWSLNIGTIAGTAVRVHVTFLLFLGWIFGAGWVAGGPGAAWQAAGLLGLLFSGVGAH